MGEIKIKSGNLFDIEHFVDTAYRHNVVLTQLDNGIRIQATSSSDPYVNYTYWVIGQTLPGSMRNAAIPCKPNTDYTLCCAQSSIVGKFLSYFDKDYEVVKVHTQFSTELLNFKTPENCAYILLRIGDSSTLSEGTIAELTNIQLLEGTYTSETIPEYQPYFLNRPAHQVTNGQWVDIPTHHYTNGRWQGELTSQSPLKFWADGEMLDWRVEGRTSGNLFDINGEYISNSRLGITCFIVVDDKLVVQIISPGSTTRISYPNNFYNPNVLYTVSVKLTGELTGIRLLSTSPFPGGTYNTTYRAYWKAMTLNNGIYTTTFAPTETATIGFVVMGADDARNPGTVENIQLLEGSYTSDTLPPYEPYGGVGDWDETAQRYKIPVNVNGVTTTLYTDHQLLDGDSIDYATDQTAIPIATGNNILTVDTAVQPKSVFVKFEG